MPSGACVIKRSGARGVVWYVKFVDAAGTQVKERVGSAAEGWTKKKAEAELRARLTDVKRDGLRKPAATTFETFAREWLDTYPEANGLKRSTVDGYTTIVEAHLIPALGRRSWTRSASSGSSGTWPTSGGRGSRHGR